VLYASHWDVSHCSVGVYKSTDGGHTWAMTDLEESGIGLIVVEAGADGEEFVYAASLWSGTLYVSADDGDTWRVLSPRDCSGLVSHPQGGVLAYCGRSLLRLEDGGATQAILGRAALEWVNTIAVSSLDPNTIFLGGERLLVSRDGGASWQELGSGLGGRFSQLRIDPHHPDVLYLEDGDNWPHNTTLYRSTDGGRTWERLITDGQGLAFDADGTWLYRARWTVLLRSDDQGRTWSEVPLPGRYGVDHIAAHPFQSGRLYLTPAERGGVLISTDGGLSWENTAASASLGTGQGSFFFDSTEGDVVYLVPFYQAFRSDDGGRTWSVCADVPWSPLTDSRAAVDPRDPDRVLLAVRGDGVWRSEDGCRSWHLSNDGLDNIFVNSLAIDPEHPDVVYAATDGGVFVSVDGGERWWPIREGLGPNPVVYSIAVDPNDSSKVYAVTPDGVFRLEGAPPTEEETAAPTPAQRVRNPENGHLYLLYPEWSKTWHQARDYCAARGGHLVTIGSTSENEFVYRLSGGLAWLGATDEAEEGTWVWVTGEPWDFTNWDEGEPNNCASTPDGSPGCFPEHYLTFSAPETSTPTTTWNDVPDGEAPFVCEWEPASP